MFTYTDFTVGLIYPNWGLGYVGRYSDEKRVVRPGFDSRQGQEIFLSSTASRLALVLT
jgi:hypothetical protein